MAQTTPLVPLAVVASMGFDGDDGFDEAVAALLAPKLNVGIPQPRFQLAATPRETDGSRSLRRVDRIRESGGEGSCGLNGLFLHKLIGRTS